MQIVVQLTYLDHTAPLIRVAEALIAQGIPAEDVPALSDNLVRTVVTRLPEAAKCIVILLPSCELCQWLGLLSVAAEKRLSRT